MAYPDIARFGYDNSYGSVGAIGTPMLTGVGASNPVGAYMQSSAPNIAGYGTSPIVTPQGVQIPSLSPTGGAGNMGGLGMNLDTFNLALRGIGTIGSLWQAWEANKLAKEQFAFQKDVTNTNLANQIQSYNTTLEDRTRARTHTEGGTAEAAQAYIDEHQLRKREI